MVCIDKDLIIIFFLIFRLEKNYIAKKKKKRKKNSVEIREEIHARTVNQWHREPLSSKHPLFWEVIKSN